MVKEHPSLVLSVEKGRYFPEPKEGVIDNAMLTIQLDGSQHLFQSSIRPYKQGVSPSWDEYFEIQLPESSLGASAAQIQVSAYVNSFSTHDLLGSVTVALPSESEISHKWHDLMKPNQSLEKRKPQLLLKLKVIPATVPFRSDEDTRNVLTKVSQSPNILVILP